MSYKLTDVRRLSSLNFQLDLIVHFAAGEVIVQRGDGHHGLVGYLLLPVFVLAIEFLCLRLFPHGALARPPVTHAPLLKLAQVVPIG